MAGMEEGSRGRGYLYNDSWLELLYSWKQHILKIKNKKWK